MQFTAAFVATLLAATTSALPSNMSPRQGTLASVAIYSASGCPANDVIDFVSLSDTTACQPLFPAGIQSAEVDTSLPAGCTLTFYTDGGCTSAQNVIVPSQVGTQTCFEFGPGKSVAGVKASGTCF